MKGESRIYRVFRIALFMGIALFSAHNAIAVPLNAFGLTNEGNRALYTLDPETGAMTSGVLVRQRTTLVALASACLGSVCQDFKLTH